MKRLGITLIAAGAVVWTAGTVAWISGVWVTLPPDAVRILVLSLSGVTGGLLVGAGALVGRATRMRRSQLSGTLEEPRAPSQLAEPDVSISFFRQGEIRTDERVP